MFRGILYIVCISSTVTGGIISQIKPKTTSNSPRGYFKTHYTCSSPISKIEWSFNVNITINVSAAIKDNVNSIVKEENGTWFYMKNTFWAFPSEATLYFSLTYNENMPSGNCTWYFGVQGDGNESSEEPSTTSKPIIDETTLSMEMTAETTQFVTFVSNKSEITEPIVVPCLCSCACQPKSKESLDKLMQLIIFDLTIPKNGTYQARQRLVSASDKRWISRGIGCVGVLVLTVVFGSILVGDLKVFAENTRQALKRIKGN